MRAFCDFKLFTELYCSPAMEPDDVRNTIVEQLSAMSGMGIRHVQVSASRLPLHFMRILLTI